MTTPSGAQRCAWTTRDGHTCRMKKDHVWHLHNNGKPCTGKRHRYSGLPHPVMVCHPFTPAPEAPAPAPPRAEDKCWLDAAGRCSNPAHQFKGNRCEDCHRDHETGKCRWWTARIGQMPDGTFIIPGGRPGLCIEAVEKRAEEAERVVLHRIISVADRFAPSFDSPWHECDHYHSEGYKYEHAEWARTATIDRGRTK